MITLPNHTNYFVGINIGNTWGECKDDAKEAPVFFVDRIIKRWDAGEFSLENTPSEYKNENGYWFNNPFSFILPYLNDYKRDRIGEVVRSIQNDMQTKPIDVKHVISNFSNYTVRAYVDDYPMNGSIDKERFITGTKLDGEKIYDEDAYDDAMWQTKFESWILDYFGEGKEIIEITGKKKVVTKWHGSMEVSDDFEEYADDFADELIIDEDDDYYSFDEDGVEYVYNDVLYDLSEVGLEEAKVKDTKYRYVKFYNNQLLISINNEMILPAVKQYLSMYKSSAGVNVLFKVKGSLVKWIKVRDAVDLSDLDSFIQLQLESNKIAGKYHNLKIAKDGSVIIKVKNPLQQKKVILDLVNNRGDATTIKVMNMFNELVGVYGVGASYDVSKLEKF